MTLPTSPTNGQVAEDATTKRKFVYSSADNTWSPVKRTDFLELEGVSSTLPSSILDKLLWDETLGEFVPTQTKGSNLVEAIYKEGTVRPTLSDVEEPGTMWTFYDDSNSPSTDTETFIASYTNPTNTQTVWRKIGDDEAGEANRPQIPVQNSAPTSPELGSLWFDNSSGSIVKKYWDSSTWQTLL